MNEKQILLDNLDRLSALEPAKERIRENLGLGDADVVEYCKEMLSRQDCTVSGMGQNRMCRVGNVIISLNVCSYMIITAHVL